MRIIGSFTRRQATFSQAYDEEACYGRRGLSARTIRTACHGRMTQAI